MSNSSISYNYLRGLQQYLQERGYSPAAFFADFSIEPGELDDASKRLDIGVYQQLLLAAGEQCHDPDIGLHIGECIVPGSYGVLGFAVMSCQCLQQALTRHQEFENLVSDRAVSRYQAKGEQIILSWLPQGQPSGRAMAEENVASWVTFSRWLTGQPIAPQAVYFQHSKPQNTSEHQRIFNCPVYFAQPRVEVHFKRSLLALPINSHDPHMQQIMDEHAAAMLGQFNQRQGLSLQMADALQKLLPQGQVTLAQVAAALAISPRTLQRRLQTQNSSFSQELEQCRRELAVGYLQQADLTLADIAFQLGFADQTAFQRAFKHWMGLTPGQYRKQ